MRTCAAAPPPARVRLRATLGALKPCALLCQEPGLSAIRLRTVCTHFMPDFTAVRGAGIERARVVEGAPPHVEAEGINFPGIWAHQVRASPW